LHRSRGPHREQEVGGSNPLAPTELMPQTEGLTRRSGQPFFALVRLSISTSSGLSGTGAALGARSLRTDVFGRSRGCAQHRHSNGAWCDAVCCDKRSLPAESARKDRRSAHGLAPADFSTLQREPVGSGCAGQSLRGSHRCGAPRRIPSGEPRDQDRSSTGVARRLTHSPARRDGRRRRRIIKTVARRIGLNRAH
jgi:hypothetical protein